MFGLLSLFLALLTVPFKSKSRLEAENAALRRQLIVLRRKMRGRVRLTNNDRLSLSKIKCEHTGGVIRQELASVECARWPERLVVPARPCLEIDVSGRHYNTACTREAHGAGAARRTRRHDQGIPVGSSRSAVQYVHSAMAIAARLHGFRHFNAV